VNRPSPVGLRAAGRRPHARLGEGNNWQLVVCFVAEPRGSAGPGHPLGRAPPRLACARRAAGVARLSDFEPHHRSDAPRRGSRRRARRRAARSLPLTPGPRAPPTLVRQTALPSSCCRIPNGVASFGTRLAFSPGVVIAPHRPARISPGRRGLPRRLQEAGLRRQRRCRVLSWPARCPGAAFAGAQAARIPPVRSRGTGGEVLVVARWFSLDAGAPCGQAGVRGWRVRVAHRPGTCKHATRRQPVGRGVWRTLELSAYRRAGGPRSRGGWGARRSR